MSHVRAGKLYLWKRGMIAQVLHNVHRYLVRSTEYEVGKWGSINNSPSSSRLQPPLVGSWWRSLTGCRLELWITWGTLISGQDVLIIIVSLSSMESGCYEHADPCFSHRSLSLPGYWVGYIGASDEKLHLYNYTGKSELLSMMSLITWRFTLYNPIIIDLTLGSLQVLIYFIDIALGTRGYSLF